MRTQSKNRKATKSMGKCSFSCHLLSLPSIRYIVFFSCIIEIMVIFLLRLNGEHGYIKRNVIGLYKPSVHLDTVGSCDLSQCSCTMRGGGAGQGNFRWGEVTQTGGQSVLGQHDDGATIFS